jgi:hypothetical protein
MEAMRTKAATSSRLQRALERLNEGELADALRRDPNFPEFLWPVKKLSKEKQEKDEDEEDHLSAAFRSAFSQMPSAMPEDVSLIGKDKSTGSSTALLSVGVVQVAEIRRTSHIGSCLGRFGVLDIIIAKLSAKLEFDSDKRITLTDVARFVWGDQSVDSDAKSLQRLNKGGFVTEKMVEKLAQCLRVHHRDLCFDNPGIYADTARNSRALSIEGRNADEAIKRREKLKAYRVELHKVDPAQADLIQKLCARSKAGGHKEHPPIVNTASISQLTTAHRFAIETLIDAILPATGNNRSQVAAAILKALILLQEVGLATWFGEYENRVALDPPQQVGALALAKARSWWQVVIAFTEAGAPAPVIIRDLSHTVDLFPTIEDILRHEGVTNVKPRSSPWALSR